MAITHQENTALPELLSVPELKRIPRCPGCLDLLNRAIGWLVTGAMVVAKDQHELMALSDDLSGNLGDNLGDNLGR